MSRLFHLAVSLVVLRHHKISLLLALVPIALVVEHVDAIVGGGGMLTVPALLSLGLPPHLTLGTNKLSACFASGTAAYTFFKKNLFQFLN